VIQTFFAMLNAGSASGSEGSKRLMELFSDKLEGEIGADELKEFESLLMAALEELDGAAGLNGKLPALPGGKDLPLGGNMQDLKAELSELSELSGLSQQDLSRILQSASGSEQSVKEGMALLREQGLSRENLESMLRQENRGLDLRNQGGLDLRGREGLMDMDLLRQGLQRRLDTLASAERLAGEGRDTSGTREAQRSVQAAGHQQLAALMSTASQSGESSSMNRLPPVQVPVGGTAWGDALGQRVLMMKGQGMDRAEIKLNPPQLGPLEIRIAVTQEQTSLVLSSQHALTRDALEQALPRLREMLQDKGLELGDAEVNDGREEQLTDDEATGDGQSDGPGQDSKANKGAQAGTPQQDIRIGLLDEYV